MKLVNMKKRNSESYIGSADTQCAGDMMQIEEIRGIVKYLNKQLRESNAVDRYGWPLQYRVSLKGREAIEKCPRGRSYQINGDVYGGLANSKRIDIYIHQRRNW